MANAPGDSKFESGVLSENRIARIDRSCADTVQASDIGAVHLLQRIACFGVVIKKTREHGQRVLPSRSPLRTLLVSKFTVAVDQRTPCVCVSDRFLQRTGLDCVHIEPTLAGTEKKAEISPLSLRGTMTPHAATH